ncbi:MAG: dihydroorotate dehydrogenase electron transfer subunit [Methanobacteriaceae archaeon]|jgi:dihydroorotate dehydrogenase electron transfer subunit|nr:dihydroorotate dehydrogenase electron transfer subunit [Methanobacteriaceae archaeon]
MKNVPNVLKIRDIIYETPSVKTFIFDWDMKINGIPKPGEFVMVWNFKNEKPMAVSFIDKFNNKIGITVKNVGEFTDDIHKLSIGDKLGIRGFYGNGFNTDLTDKKILAIGAGVGMGPIKAFALDSILKNLDLDILIAAVTKEELLFVDDLKNKGFNVSTCTNDGTCGFKGYATDKAIDLLKNNNYDEVIVCGPEGMMIEIFDLFEKHNINGQYSMERYMKCAIGICGQCCVDNTGWRICVEGPVFSSEDLKKINEFGKYKRDAKGTKKHY